MSVETSASHDDLRERCCLAVTTTALEGVQRVLSLLRQRRYDVRSFHAHESDQDTRWTVECVIGGDGTDVDLLLDRLHRLPCVLTAQTG